MESDFANLLVYEYLKSVNNKTAKLFKKHKRIKEEPSPSVPTIADVVKYFGETAQNSDPDHVASPVNTIDRKRKRKAEVAGDTDKDDKETRNELGSTECRKIYIKNLCKKAVFDDLKVKVGEFGEVTKFHNSGRGFGFLTFSTVEAAVACNASLNNTKIGRKTIKTNIDKEKTASAFVELSSEATAPIYAKETFTKRVEGCTLFVNGVKQNTINSSLEEIFAKFGNVTKALNTEKGYAFVTFSSPEEAASAMEALNGMEVCGTKVCIDVSQEGGKALVSKKEAAINSIRVFVNNVKKDACKDDIKAVFKAHGKVTDVQHHGKDFAFVSFASAKSAGAAVKALNGQIWPKFCEKEIECNIARVQKGRKRRKRSKKDGSQ